MDYDGDACSVTELSLILTLLDYVEPPDLEEGNGPRFELPSLRGENMNLAEVLFAGRSRVPAAALFYSPRPGGNCSGAFRWLR